MPAKKRFKTKYPGVYYVEGTRVNGKPERIYYIRYRKNKKLIEEKAGRQYRDDMTPARAARIRAMRMKANALTNKERRELERKRKEAEQKKWTINRLWEEYKRQKPKNKSIEVDDGRYRNYLKDSFGDKEPRQLVQLDVERLRVKLLKKLSPQTVKHVLGVLKRIINFGANNGLCEPPRFKIKMPQVNNKKTEDLTPEQLQRLLEAIEQDKHPCAGKIMLLALYTGMRRNEILRLKWDDINFEKGFITIRNPKSGTDQVIPLNKSARDIFFSIPRYSEFVFPAPTGDKPVQNIYPALKRIRERAGLPKDFRPLHGLRHVYASMLASSGKVDMYTLQKLLTHKSPQMTQRYAHLRDEALRRASNLVTELLVKQKSGKVVKLKTRGH